MPNSADVSTGSPDRFGFSWDTYAELLPDHEEQFRRWTSSLEPADWRDAGFLADGCSMERNSCYWPPTYGARQGLAVDIDARTLRLGVSRSPNMRRLRTLGSRHLPVIVSDQIIPRTARYCGRDEAVALPQAAGILRIQACWTNETSWTACWIKLTIQS